LYRKFVGTFRSYLMRRRIWAMWLIAAALLVKILVPAGYMPGISSGSLVIELCSGLGPEKIVMAIPGMAAHHGQPDHSGKGDIACGFSGHAPAQLSAADPIFVLMAILFIVMTLFRMPITGTVHRARFLRPPLRGPPVIA